MKKNSDHNPFADDENNFALPEDYFQKSAAKIAAKIEWQEEHKAFPQLADHKAKATTIAGGFVIPKNYFSTNETKLELSEYPLLKSLRIETGFSVPLNYFDELEVGELAQKLVDSENELNGLERLRLMNKENSFSVKEDYFSKNEAQVIDKLIVKNVARIIPLNWIRFVSGIAALLIVVLSYYTYRFYFAPVSLSDCGTMACVDKKELIKTTNLENLEDEELYELVSPQKLEEKLGMEGNKTTLEDSSLKNVSTEDLLDEI